MDENIVYKEILESTGAGSWCYNISLDQFELSQACLNILDFPKDLGITLTDVLQLVPEDGKDIIVKNFLYQLKTKSVFEQELQVFTGEGKLIWVRINVFSKNKEGQKIWGIIKNINEEKKLTHSYFALAAEQIRYKNTLNKIAIIAETDLRGTITYVNQKFCEVSGFSKEELIGNNHRVLNSGYHDKTFFKHMWDILKSQRLWSGRICNQSKSNELYWVETYIAPVYKDGNHSGYLSIRFDITDKIRLQEEIEMEKESARFNAQLAAVGEMSASIAHEIANPLAVIYGSGRLITKHRENESKMEFHQNSIEKSVERINKIIKGLKRLSRKSQGEDFEIVKFKDVMDETLDFCQESLKAQHIHFEREELSENIYLKCREVEISQVFLNLFNNARDAILESRVKEKWIKLHYQFSQTEIRIDVIDSGPGIPEKIRDKIMESFFTTKAVGKGTGLGLSLVKRIVDSHSGKFELLRDADNTTFRIVLPRFDMK